MRSFSSARRPGEEDEMRAHALHRLLASMAVTVLLAGCAGSTPSVPADSPGGPGSSGPSPVASMSPTALIVDTDMGADDVMALLYLLRDPSVAVQAITVSGTGLVHAWSGGQIVSNLLGALDLRGIPIGVGDEMPLQGTRAFPDSWRTLTDDAYGISVPVIPWTSQPAVDVLASTIASSATPVAVLTLGPLTNLGQALLADPSLATKIASVHVSGGAIDVPGNVAAEGGDPAATAAEWNLWIDPAADDVVLRSGIPITLVPLDATGQLPLTPAFFETLTQDHAAAGADIVYELLARSGGALTGNFFWDQFATVSLTDPSVATFKAVPLHVVTEGSRSGSLVQDASGTQVRYTSAPDPIRFESVFLQGLRRGAARENPFTLAGSLEVTFDGATCGGTPAGPIAPGTYAIDFSSSAAGETLLAVMQLHEGATWQQMLDDAKARGPNPGDMSPPGFADVLAAPTLNGSGTVPTFADFTQGTFGFVCLQLSPTSAIVPAPAAFESPG